MDPTNPFFSTTWDLSNERSYAISLPTSTNLGDFDFMSSEGDSSDHTAPDHHNNTSWKPDDSFPTLSLNTTLPLPRRPSHINISPEESIFQMSPSTTLNLNQRIQEKQRSPSPPYSPPPTRVLQRPQPDSPSSRCRTASVSSTSSTTSTFSKVLSVDSCSESVSPAKPKSKKKKKRSKKPKSSAFELEFDVSPPPHSLPLAAVAAAEVEKRGRRRDLETTLKQTSFTVEESDYDHDVSSRDDGQDCITTVEQSKDLFTNDLIEPKKETVQSPDNGAHVVQSLMDLPILLLIFLIPFSYKITSDLPVVLRRKRVEDDDSDQDDGVFATFSSVFYWFPNKKSLDFCPYSDCTNRISSTLSFRMVLGVFVVCLAAFVRLNLLIVHIVRRRFAVLLLSGLLVIISLVFNNRNAPNTSTEWYSLNLISCSSIPAYLIYWSFLLSSTSRTFLLMTLPYDKFTRFIVLICGVIVPPCSLATMKITSVLIYSYCLLSLRVGTFHNGSTWIGLVLQVFVSRWLTYFPKTSLYLVLLLQSLCFIPYFYASSGIERRSLRQRLFKRASRRGFV
ncbi:hypothetical protein GEMRC1_006337 [Eukaryota sp. GEM-RC1]